MYKLALHTWSLSRGVRGPLNETCVVRMPRFERTHENKLLYSVSLGACKQNKLVKTFILTSKREGASYQNIQQLTAWKLHSSKLIESYSSSLIRNTIERSSGTQLRCRKLKREIAPLIALLLFRTNDKSFGTSTRRRIFVVDLSNKSLVICKNDLDNSATNFIDVFILGEFFVGLISILDTQS